LFPEVVALLELLRVRTDLETLAFDDEPALRFVVTAELFERLLVERLLPDALTAELPLDVPEAVPSLKDVLRRELLLALRTALLFGIRSEELRPSERIDELLFDERMAELRLNDAVEREPDEDTAEREPDER
jgi:hypothetical protein